VIECSTFVVPKQKDFSPCSLPMQICPMVMRFRLCMSVTRIDAFCMRLMFAYLPDS